MAVWKGEMELPMSSRWTEDEGREPAREDCTEEGTHTQYPKLYYLMHLSRYDALLSVFYSKPTVSCTCHHTHGGR